MSAETGGNDAPRTLLALYDEALPTVYGYFVRRCSDRGTAEDLTSETFLAAMDAARKNAATPISVPWLVGVARHKLADHYRRRHDRFSIPVAELPEPAEPADDWDAELDRIVAESVLARLPEHHRTVLALRYMDDCTVGECAELIGRTVHATEALLVRARRAFRTHYPEPEGGGVMNNNRDPFSVLHGDELPVQPDPAFASRLRRRLESAVSLFGTQPNRTQGVDMSGTDAAIAELSETETAAGLPRPAALPYLAVANAHDAIAWYVDALGAVVLGDPIVMDDGRIGHAELGLGGGVLYLADEYPEIGLKAPAPQANSVSLMLEVADTDAALQRVRERGAQVQREPYEAHGSRGAAIIDPFGHRWMLSGPMTGAAVPIQHGDVGYVSLWTPDADRAAAFYSHVLGWTYDPATHRVTNTREHIGIYSVPGQHTLFCAYAVADLASARRAIVQAGGTVDEFEEFDFGTLCGATDSSGASFAVFEPVAGTGRPDLNGSGPGELSYITYEVTDATDFKSFFSGLLYWTFEPGRIDDGWQVQGPHPMAGVAGGSDAPATVPMWTVADIDEAVARVRQAGGTVIDEPSQQAYGKSALCTDDQGTRFYLGEF